MEKVKEYLLGYLFLWLFAAAILSGVSGWGFWESAVIALALPFFVPTAICILWYAVRFLVALISWGRRDVQLEPPFLEEHWKKIRVIAVITAVFVIVGLVPDSHRYFSTLGYPSPLAAVIILLSVSLVVYLAVRVSFIWHGRDTESRLAGLVQSYQRNVEIREMEAIGALLKHMIPSDLPKDPWTRQLLEDEILAARAMGMGRLDAWQYAQQRVREELAKSSQRPEDIPDGDE